MIDPVSRDPKVFGWSRDDVMTMKSEKKQLAKPS